MASSKEYLDYIMEQLSGLEGISCRAMMGEFLLYYRGKVVGGVYDNRFLVKPTPAANALLPEAPAAQPYPGAKDMLEIEDPEDRALMEALLPAIYADLDRKKHEKEQIRRISGYEQILREAQALLSRDALTESEAEALREKAQALEAYYTSDQWKRDLADDEAGLLPKNLRRGVLSEDGIDSLLSRYGEWLKNSGRE